MIVVILLAGRTVATSLPIESAMHDDHVEPGEMLFFGTLKYDSQVKAVLTNNFTSSMPIKFCTWVDYYRC